MPLWHGSSASSWSIRSSSSRSRTSSSSGGVRSAASSAAASTGDAAAAAAARSGPRGGGVFVSVAGAPLLELSAGHHAVPLLEPAAHGVPFAVALRVVHPGAAPAQLRESGAAAAAAGADAAELHYVLGGAGELLGADGAAAPVAPGDSVLAAQGAAVFSVPARAANSDGRPMPLVMLQVLLPGKMLRDMAGGQRTAVGFDPSELGLTPEWAAPSVPKAGRVTPELLCRLLTPEAARSPYGRAARAAAAVAAEAAGAGPQPDPQQQQQQQQHEQQHQQQQHHGPLLAGAGLELAPLSGAGARPLLKRSLAGVRAWRMPNATNQLALVFSPQTDPELSMTFGVEMFEPGHRTARHVHGAAYEMFVVLGGGGGVGVGGGARVPLRAGDVAVFPPGVVHAIDNDSPSERLFCLQLMLPNEMFAEYVASGALLGPLDGDVDAAAGGGVFGTC